MQEAEVGANFEAWGSREVAEGGKSWAELGAAEPEESCVWVEAAGHRTPQCRMSYYDKELAEGEGLEAVRVKEMFKAGGATLRWKKWFLYAWFVPPRSKNA